jgi:hypothetical protein
MSTVDQNLFNEIFKNSKNSLEENKRRFALLSDQQVTATLQNTMVA